MALAKIDESVAKAKSRGFLSEKFHQVSGYGLQVSVSSFPRKRESIALDPSLRWGCRTRHGMTDISSKAAIA
jgi:hypothetical protein